MEVFDDAAVRLPTALDPHLHDDVTNRKRHSQEHLYIGLVFNETLNWDREDRHSEAY